MIFKLLKRLASIKDRTRSNKHRKNKNYISLDQYFERSHITYLENHNIDLIYANNLVALSRNNEAVHVYQRIINCTKINLDKEDNVNFYFDATIKLAELAYFDRSLDLANKHIQNLPLPLNHNRFFQKLLLQAQIALCSARTEEAIDFYEKIISMDFKKIINVHKDYFEALLVKHPGLNIENYLETKYEYISNYFYNLALARFSKDKGDYKNALKYSNRITNPLKVRYMLCGEIYFAEGNHSQCIKNFYDAWKQEKLNFQPLKHIIICYLSFHDNFITKLSIKFILRIPAIKSKPPTYRKLTMMGKNPLLMFESYNSSQGVKGLKLHYGNKYISHIEPNMGNDKSLLILPLWGLGDEIITASLYEHIVASCGSLKVSIGCDPRLFSLLSRSFTRINFISIARLYKGKASNKFTLHQEKEGTKLPHNWLYYSLDYEGWRQSQTYDFIAAVPIISKSMFSLSATSGKSYIKTSPSIADKIKTDLDKISLKPKIGITWRSGNTGSNRSIYYTDLLEWREIFALNNQYDFINLQYDNCSQEILEAEQKFGIKIHNLEYVDLYNDLESVTALIDCLDLTICPCNLMAELSGATGTRCLYLLNSPEGNWRINTDDTDLWFNSIAYAKPDQYGDKTSLLKNAAKLIEELIPLKPSL